MEKKKVDIYVKGSIYYIGLLSVGLNGVVDGGVAENDERYDFSEALVIDGDITLSSPCFTDKIVVSAKSVVAYFDAGNCRIGWDDCTYRVEKERPLWAVADTYISTKGNILESKLITEKCILIDGDFCVLPDGTALTYMDGSFKSYAPGKYCIGQNARLQTLK